MNPTFLINTAFFFSIFVTFDSYSTAFFIPGAKIALTPPSVNANYHSSTRERPRSRNRPPTTTTMSSSGDSGTDPDPRVGTDTKPLVRNFRSAAGLSSVYRCASTDDLGGLFTDASDGPVRAPPASSPEAILLSKIGLVLDLRSPSERDETRARRWTTRAPGGAFTIVRHERRDDGRPWSPPVLHYRDNRERAVFRIDVLSPKRLFRYCARNWIVAPADRARYAWNAVFDSRALHGMMMDALNGRGLVGLYEAIIETGGDEIFHSLRAITEYFEGCGCGAGGAGGVVVHCVQGKDRTGLVIMLCQSIVGVEDGIIVADYHRSDRMGSSGGNVEGSAAVDAMMKTEGVQRGKLSREIFEGAPMEAMVVTLGYIREKYGSIFGYLDSIGFDAEWRARFLTVQRQPCGEERVIPLSKL